MKKGATGNLLASGLLKLESLPALVRALTEGEAQLETLRRPAERARPGQILQDYRAQIAAMEQYFGLARLVRSISHQVIDTAYSGIERAALGVMDGLHVATLHAAHVQRKKASGRRRLPARGVFVTLETPWTNYKRPRTPREMQGLVLRGLFATDLVETVRLDHLIVSGHMGG